MQTKPTTNQILKRNERSDDVNGNLFRSEPENALGRLPLGEDGVGHGEVAGAPATCIGEGGG